MAQRAFDMDFRLAFAPVLESQTFILEGQFNFTEANEGNEAEGPWTGVAADLLPVSKPGF
jgi:hypothetical protein